MRPLVPVALGVLALALMWPLPRLLARMRYFRRAPRAALFVWQLVALAGIVAALAVAPAVVGVLDAQPNGRPTWLIVLAVAVSGGMLLQLLRSGHIVGRRLRAVRREHRELVDLIGTRADDLGTSTRLLEHPTPTAYCVPGLRQRIVLTRGTLDRLPPDELAAVVAHERAHLHRRHDLVVEFFTVLHVAVPPFLRAEAALDEIRLLVEALADRSAAREVGPLTVGRALGTVAGARVPDVALGLQVSPAAAATRITLLTRPAPVWVSPLMYAFGASVLALPVLLLALAYR